MTKYNVNGDGSMPPFTELDGFQPENSLNAAIMHTRMGLHPTPLNGKQPILLDWLNKELAEEELTRHFGNGQNIGLVLGGPAGLVDVDLDNSVAIAVADHLLPGTLESGREKRPRSHRWYLSNPLPKSATYALPRKMVDPQIVEPGEVTLVELRSTGRQTAVAPSVHPDGDRYVWHSGKICSIDGAELAELVEDVAIATLLALHWPDGSRQHFALHAAGYLGRHMEHERVEAIMEAASLAVDDEEHPKRMRAVQDTLGKLRKETN